MTETGAGPAANGTPPRPPGTARSFQRRMVGALAVLAVLLAALAWASSSVPVRLTAVTPGDGGAVAQPPEQVELTFSGSLTPESVFVQVSSADGASVSRGRPTVEGQRLLVPVSITARGTYLVVYRLGLGGDREVAGRTGFTVGPVPLVGASSELGQAADDSAAHDHAHAEGPWNGALLVLDAGLVAGVVVLMVRRPRARAR
ncbi:copper resistance CopC family protein [Kitasatospora sp. NPDC057015]|uniref:copper resistance CopC family protein n=1 Tax=Kitasatospora sp. NPDC057015 TaxID=3346001 RepID=UPI00364311A7